MTLSIRPRSRPPAQSTMRPRATVVGTHNLVGDLVDALFVLHRTTRLHGATHPAVSRAADRAREAQTKTGPLTLQVVEGMLFRDGRLVPLVSEDHERLHVLQDAMDQRGVGELVFGVPPLQSFVALAAALCDPAIEFSEKEITLSELDVERGDESEEVAPEVFVATQFALAISDAEALRRGDEWDERHALAVVRRIERAWERSGALAGAILERAPGEWNVARRAVAAVSHATAVLTRLETARSIRRVVCHAVLVTSIRGFRKRSGLPFEEAIGRARTEVEALPTRTSSLDPHRQRLVTLLHAAASEEPSLGIVSLLQLAYGIERERCPDGEDGALEITDLFAYAAANMGRLFDVRWVRAFISLYGLMPAGTRVRLEDGRIGVALGPGRRADRPMVLVDGLVQEAAGPVTRLTSEPAHRKVG